MPANNNRIYRIQVGAYRDTNNAKEAFDRLAAVGFSPAYEHHGDLYRVIISGFRSQDMPEAARFLGYAGFVEVLIREER